MEFHPFDIIGIIACAIIALYLLLSLFLFIRGLYLWRKSKGQITWNPYWNSKQLTWWDLLIVILLPLISFVAMVCFHRLICFR